jgi:hypothetical protein
MSARSCLSEICSDALHIHTLFFLSLKCNSETHTLHLHHQHLPAIKHLQPAGWFTAQNMLGLRSWGAIIQRSANERDRRLARPITLNLLREGAFTAGTRILGAATLPQPQQISNIHHCRYFIAANKSSKLRTRSRFAIWTSSMRRSLLLGTCSGCGTPNP